MNVAVALSAMPSAPATGKTLTRASCVAIFSRSGRSVFFVAIAIISQLLPIVTQDVSQRKAAMPACGSPPDAAGRIERGQHQMALPSIRATMRAVARRTNGKAM